MKPVLTIVEHDHEIHEDRLLAMAESQVAAKMVHISVDAKLWADRDEFIASMTAKERALERERVGADTFGDQSGTGDDDLVPPGYLRAAMVAIDHLWTVVENHPDRLAIALESTDVESAFQEGRSALILSTEGSRSLEGRLEPLRCLYRLGLRQLGLSWAARTPIGDPQSAGVEGKLSAFGKEVVAECNRLGIIVDVDHLSIGAIEDVLETTTSPVVASHCAAQALNPTQPTAYPDSILRGIADGGGVIAHHFMSQVVKPGREPAPLDALLAQIDYTTDILGPDHIALGPDFGESDPRLWLNQGIEEPFTYVSGADSIELVPGLFDVLIGRGYSQEAARRIMGENLLHLFATVRSLRNDSPRAIPAWNGEYGVMTDGTTPL